MDARTNIKARLPSRHLTEGPERAPHRSYHYAMDLTSARIHQPSSNSTKAALHLPAIAHECGIRFDLFDAVETFKKTPCIADLKSGGRYVAKDMFEADGVTHIMKTLLEQGYGHGDSMHAIGHTIAASLATTKRNPHQDVVNQAHKPITVPGGGVWLKSNLASGGSIPGGAEEKLCYADI